MSDSEASAQVAAKGAYKADQIKGATAEEVMWLHMIALTAQTSEIVFSACLD